MFIFDMKKEIIFDRNCIYNVFIFEFFDLDDTTQINIIVNINIINIY